MSSSSLEISDQMSRDVAKEPTKRVSLDDIKNNIRSEYFTTAEEAVGGPSLDVDPALRLLTLCFLVTNNGFVVVGKSAPAAPENFNVELGQKFARDDAMRQLWPLMGYALREKLDNE